MAAPFTEKEKESVKKALKQAASDCISTVGMRGATVDRLAKSAGISKGAFYEFYDTKELLFFEVLEDWHGALYRAAMDVLTNRTDLGAPERAAAAIMRVCDILQKHSLMTFVENDLPLLLRKIPTEVLDQHYHSDDVHIGDIIRKSGLRLKQPPEVASAAVRAIFLSLQNRSQIGECFPTVLELMVRGICDRLVDS